MSIEGAAWFALFGFASPIAMTVLTVMNEGWIGLLWLLLIPILWVFAMEMFGIWR
jgi:hypothetical protein